MARNSAWRPTSWGGRNSAAGSGSDAAPPDSCSAPVSTRCSKASVSGAGLTPSSPRRICSQRSNAANAAARSPRWVCNRIRRRQACSSSGSIASSCSVAASAAAVAWLASCRAARPPSRWARRAAHWRRSSSSQSCNTPPAAPPSTTPPSNGAVKSASSAQPSRHTSHRTASERRRPVSVSVTASPHWRRSRNRRWRRLARARDSGTSGHSHPANRLRGCSPSSARRASNAMSLWAKARHGASPKRQAATPSRRSRSAAVGAVLGVVPGLTGKAGVALASTVAHCGQGEPAADPFIRGSAPCRLAVVGAGCCWHERLQAQAVVGRHHRLRTWRWRHRHRDPQQPPQRCLHQWHQHLQQCRFEPAPAPGRGHQRQPGAVLAVDCGF